MDALALLLLRLLAHMPLRFNLWLGRRAGAIAWRLGGREKRVALANLAFCFPAQTEGWRRQTARGAILSMAEALFEAPRLWRMTPRALRARLDNPDVLEEIVEVQRQGDGLVIAAPHLGSWEYVGGIVGAELPMTNMFRPPKYPSVGRYVRAARERIGGTLAPTDVSGVRMLSRALMQGGTGGILPDQEPERGAGVFAPFFGRDAYTMTLLPRLVRKRRTPVLFVFAERLSGGRYRLHCITADEKLYSDDPVEAAAALNAGVEALVRRRIEQYNWNYKRFLEQPDGATDIYRKKTDD